MCFGIYFNIKALFVFILCELFEKKTLNFLVDNICFAGPRGLSVTRLTQEPAFPGSIPRSGHILSFLLALIEKGLL